MQVVRWEDITKEIMSESISRRVITGERAMVAEINIAQGALVPTHHHESEQISYCLEGRLKLEIEGQKFVLNPGDILVIPSQVPHSALALEDFRGLDIFSPIREDWLRGDDDYLRKK